MCQHSFTDFTMLGFYLTVGFPLSATVLILKFIAEGGLEPAPARWVVVVSSSKPLTASSSRQLDPPNSPQLPYPQSHSFSRSYGTILPTSHIYIILIGQRLLTLET